MTKRLKFIQVEGCSNCQRYKAEAKRERKKRRQTIESYERILDERPMRDNQI